MNNQELIKKLKSVQYAIDYYDDNNDLVEVDKQFRSILFEHSSTIDKSWLQLVSDVQILLDEYISDSSIWDGAYIDEMDHIEKTIKIRLVHRFGHSFS
jgi:t-SNARE complex subunit (syntaxin)